MGSNGSGKTTLLKLISGIYIPSNGFIKINGSVASLFNDDDLFTDTLSLKDNLIFLLKLFDQYSIDNLENIFKKIQIMIDFNINLSSNLKDFSKNEIKLISIITIINLKSDILLLDEIFNKFKFNFTKKIFKILKSQSRKKLIIFVTHDLDLINSFTDEVILIQDKKIHEGPKFELISKYYNEHGKNYFNSYDKISMIDDIYLHNGKNRKFCFDSSNNVSIALKFKNNIKKKNILIEIICEKVSNNISPQIKLFYFKKNFKCLSQLFIENFLVIKNFKLGSNQYIVKLRVKDQEKNISNKIILPFEIKNTNREDMNDTNTGALLSPLMNWKNVHR